jgi:adenylate cyclase
LADWGDIHGDEDAVDFLKQMDNHLPRMVGGVLRRLPSEPRCHLCHAPYGGVGGRIVKRLGFGPSRKNPNLCSVCFEQAPMGGAETETGILFVDVRGFTSTSEAMAPGDVAALLNRFYEAASTVLKRHAIIDKLVGDEVMALYFPFLLSERWGDDMVEDAAHLLAAVGYGSPEGPWLRLGIGLDVGRAYVGNVGSGEVKDFTAVGDVVNTAARLQGAAGEGQIVMSERVFELLDDPPPCTSQELELKGKAAPEPVRVMHLGAEVASAAG